MCGPLGQHLEDLTGRHPGSGLDRTDQTRRRRTQCPGPLGPDRGAPAEHCAVGLFPEPHEENPPHRAGRVNHGGFVLLSGKVATVEYPAEGAAGLLIKGVERTRQRALRDQRDEQGSAIGLSGKD